MPRYDRLYVALSKIGMDGIDIAVVCQQRFWCMLRNGDQGVRGIAVGSCIDRQTEGERSSSCISQTGKSASKSTTQAAKSASMSSPLLPVPRHGLEP